ncbi:MAG: hypothetical protein JSV86_16860 [Gemmatimonadota bacterium]|nr:MAG: hypothetical protein JSV86_16860 [Gemmatimonadota bacterium]
MTMKFNRIRSTAQAVARSRDTVRPEAVKAVREIERALQEALEGEPLRGLRNLGGSAMFAGARVRGKTDKKLPGPDSQKGERDFLCLNAKGQLVIVWWEDVGDDMVEIRERPVRDDELVAGDATDLLNTVQQILPRHVEHAERARARYNKAALLAQRVQLILAPEGGR